MEKLLSSSHCRSFLLENHQELALELHNVLGIDRFAPGHIVRVDEPLVVKERKDHLFVPGGIDLCLDRSRLALFGSLLQLLL